MTKIIVQTDTHQNRKCRWHVSLEWKPQDCWIGAFWDITRGARPVLNLWVTIIPCFPIHVFVQRWRRYGDLPRG